MPADGPAREAAHRACALLTNVVALGWQDAAQTELSGAIAWSDLDLVLAEEVFILASLRTPIVLDGTVRRRPPSADAARAHASRRRISQIVAARRTTASAVSQPNSIHWNVQYRLPGW